MKPEGSKKKDFGYADHEFACELVKNGSSDTAVRNRLMNERGFSPEKADRYLEQAKRDHARRPTPADRGKLVIGVVMTLIGIPIAVGGLLIGFRPMFWLGIICFFGGALQLSPKLDIRR